MASVLTVGLLAAGCGGGGGGQATSPPPPNPLYVSAQRGSDTNLGDFDHPLATISNAARLAGNDYVIFVGPGVYDEPQGVTTNRTGTVPQGVAFIADPSGATTGDPVSGPVVLDVSRGTAAGFLLSNTGCDGSSCGMIDGFEIRGSHDAAIVLKSGSNGFIIENCLVHDNSGDGIRVQDSANVTIVNNLVYNSGGNGIGIVGNNQGSQNADVVNNTVYGSQGYGLLIGTSNAASAGAFVRNNILQHNAMGMGVSGNIKVTSTPTARSEVNYDGNYNLVFDPVVYLGPSIAGVNDINQDALFVGVVTDDFHVQANSPAIDAGGSTSNVMEVDVTVDSVSGQPVRQSLPLSDVLSGLTTTGGGVDSNALDLGYHFAQ